MFVVIKKDPKHERSFYVLFNVNDQTIAKHVLSSLPQEMHVLSLFWKQNYYCQKNWYTAILFEEVEKRKRWFIWTYLLKYLEFY